MVDPAIEQAEQLRQFAADLRVAPQQFGSFLNAGVATQHTIGNSGEEHVQQTSLSFAKP